MWGAILRDALSHRQRGDVALYLQILVTGLATGAGYGLVAIAYALIYRLTGVVHFALGELIGLAVFVTLLVAAGTGPVTQTNVDGWRFVGALVVGVLVAGAVGALSYALVRPFLRRANAIGWIGAIVGLTFALRGLLAATFVRESYVFPDPIPFHRLSNGGVIQLGGGAALPVRSFYVLAAGILLAAAATWFLERSQVGEALQALASNRTGAAAVGLPVDRLLVLAFVLTGVLASVAGVVAAPAGPVSANTGALLGLNGLAAALMTRFGTGRSVFVAGLGLGVLEVAVATLHVGGLRLGAEYRDILPLAVAVAVMAVRGRGQTLAEVE